MIKVRGPDLVTWSGRKAGAVRVPGAPGRQFKGRGREHPDGLADGLGDGARLHENGRHGPMWKDLAALTPPLTVAAVFIGGLFWVVRREMGGKRRREDAPEKRRAEQ